MHPCINRWPKIKSLYKGIKNLFCLQYTLSFPLNILVNLTISNYDIISISMKWDFMYQEYRACSSNVITKLIMIVTFAKNDLLKGIDCLHSTSRSFIVLKILKVYCLKVFWAGSILDLEISKVILQQIFLVDCSLSFSIELLVNHAWKRRNKDNLW